jgi:hypothetical protein
VSIRRFGQRGRMRSSGDTLQAGANAAAIFPFAGQAAVAISFYKIAPILNRRTVGGRARPAGASESAPPECTHSRNRPPKWWRGTNPARGRSAAGRSDACGITNEVHQGHGRATEE